MQNFKAFLSSPVFSEISLGRSPSSWNFYTGPDIFCPVCIYFQISTDSFPISYVLMLYKIIKHICSYKRHEIVEPTNKQEPTACQS